MAEEVKGVQPEAQPEQAPKLEELQKQIEALMTERDNLKKAISASNSDAAKKKKEAEEWANKYKSTLSEQERKDMESKAAFESVQAELATYKDKERVASYTAKLMEAGMDAATASQMAAGLPPGVDDSFFVAQKAFNDGIKQTVKTQVLNSQPSLSSGMPLQTDNQDKDLRRWIGLK